MGLVLSLQKEEHDSLLTKMALAMAMESYMDLQNSYGFAMRSSSLLDISNVMSLIAKINNTAIGDLLTFDINDTLTLVTSFDITLKLLRSPHPFRFIHAFVNNKPKQLQIKLELLTFCKEMIKEISEQGIYRFEVDERKQELANFVYN